MIPQFILDSFNGCICRKPPSSLTQNTVLVVRKERKAIKVAVVYQAKLIRIAERCGECLKPSGGFALHVETAAVALREAQIVFLSINLNE